MSAKEAQTMRRLIDSIKNADRGKTSGYDTTATVRRIEGGTAWVHIPGGVDETPVKLTIAAAPGDSVQVRVSGGRAFLVGNATAPPTDDTTARAAVKQIGAVSKVVKTVQRIAERAAKIAGNTNQYFWHTESGTDTGAHITEIPQEEFLKDPENGGGNLLARSNGIAVRSGLDELASFSQNGLAVEMPEGAYQPGVGLTFNRAGEQIGRVWSSTLYGKFAVFEGLKHAVLYGLTNADIFAPKVFIAHYDPSSTAVDPEDCDVEISGTLTVSGAVTAQTISADNHKVGCSEKGTDGYWTWYKYSDGSFDMYRRTSATITSYYDLSFLHGYYADYTFPAWCKPNNANYGVFTSWKIGTGFGWDGGVGNKTTSGFRAYAMGSASGSQACVIDLHVHGTYQ